MEQEVDAFKGRLLFEPACAVAGLRQSSLGCAWLIGRWQYLSQVLQEYRVFNHASLKEMVRLSGQDPDINAPQINIPEMWDLVMHADLMTTQCDDGSNCWLYRWREVAPVEMQQKAYTHWADPAANYAWFQARIDGAIDELKTRAEMLRTGREAAARAAAEDKALMLHDDKKAALWLRYSKEANTEFYRALKELRELLEQEAEADEESDAGREFPKRIDGGAEASYRNELNEPAESLLLEDCQEVYDASDEVDSEPVSGPEEEVVAEPVAAAQEPSRRGGVRGPPEPAASAAVSAPSEPAPAACANAWGWGAAQPLPKPIERHPPRGRFDELQRFKANRPCISPPITLYGAIL